MVTTTAMAACCRGSVRSNYPSFLEVPSDPSDVQDGSLRVCGRCRRRCRRRRCRRRGCRRRCRRAMMPAAVPSSSLATVAGV